MAAFFLSFDRARWYPQHAEMALLFDSSPSMPSHEEEIRGLNSQSEGSTKYSFVDDSFESRLAQVE